MPASHVTEAAMSKVGRFVTDPRAGSYCQITLDSGEKIIVNHDKTRLTIELSKLFGLSSDRLFSCDLDTPGGRAALATMTASAQAGTADATPLGALVKHVKDCGTATEVRARCAALIPAA
jgi:hypothetical protein